MTYMIIRNFFFFTHICKENINAHMMFNVWIEGLFINSHPRNVLIVRHHSIERKRKNRLDLDCLRISLLISISYFSLSLCLMLADGQFI